MNRSTGSAKLGGSCAVRSGMPLVNSRQISMPRTRRTLIVRSAKGDVLLEVKGLEAKIATTGQQILKGVNLTLREGEIHAIMGKNGSGKSTFSKVGPLIKNNCPALHADASPPCFTLFPYSHSKLTLFLMLLLFLTAGAGGTP